MSKADIMAGRSYVSLYIKNDLTKGLKVAKQDLNDFGSSILGVGAKVAGMGTAIVGSLAGAVMHFSNVGDALGKMSARTGVSAAALSELGFAAEQSGGTIEDVESSLQRMAKNLGGVGPESIKTKEALLAMGLSVEAIQGMNPEQQFEAIAEGIANIQNPTQKAAAAMAVFGASGRQLIPMLGDIKALRQEAKELGLSPSPESIKAAEEINDAINRVRRVIGAAVFEIGAALAPMAMEVMGGFLSVVKAIKKFVTENKALVITAAKVGAALMAAGAAIMAIGGAFIAAGAAIGGVLSVFSALSAAVGMAMSVMGAIGAVLAAVFSPIGLLVAALIGGVYAWARFTESGRAAVSGISGFITETFGGLLTTVKDTFGGIVAAVRSGDLALAGQIAMVGLRLIFAQGLEAIHALFGEAIGTLVGQLLNGDFSGAWSTLGSMVLDSVAQITAGIVGLFTGAANAVMSKWQETVNAISDLILQSAAKGGVMGWALEKISGVDMEAEVARGKEIERKRLAAGMTPDTGGPIVDSTQFQHPGLEAMKQAVADAGKAANAGMGAATDATGAALDEKTTGKAAEASAAVKALQDELAALNKQAKDQVTSIESGAAEKKAFGGMSGGFGGGGRASAASFSLSALSQMASRGPESKQLAATQKVASLAEDQVEKLDEVVGAVKGWSLHHA